MLAKRPNKVQESIRWTDKNVRSDWEIFLVCSDQSENGDQFEKRTGTDTESEILGYGQNRDRDTIKSKDRAPRPSHPLSQEIPEVEPPPQITDNPKARENASDRREGI